jgi:L-fucose isomerase-like protein
MREGRKVLLVPAHFGSLDEEPMARYMAEARESLRNGAIDFFETPSLRDLDSVRAIDAQIATVDHDAILIYLITWVDPNVVVDFLSHHIRTPVIFWIVDYFRCGDEKIHLGALAGFLPLKGTLEKMGTGFVYLYNNRNIEESVAELSHMIDSASAVGGMRRARIGMVGYTALGMYPGMVDPLQIKTLFGTEIIPLDSYTLVGRCDANLQSPDLQQKVDSCFRGLHCTEEVSLAERDKCAAMTDAIRQLVAEYGLSAITIRCCFEMATGYGFAPCVPLSVLCDEFVTSCESDMPLTLTQLILHYLEAKPVPYVDLILVEDYRIYASCCGFSAFAYASGASRCVAHSDLAGQTTKNAFKRVITTSRYEEGQYTLARLTLPRNGKRIYRSSWARTGMTLKLSGSSAVKRSPVWD